MSVDLQPAELGFKRPFSHEVSQVLRLSNPNSDPVAFKVKTTAPKQYCVRPNSGRIDPGSSVEVQVLLQAMKEDPPADARCKDKFLVQSVAITGGQDTTNIAQIWTNIEQTAKSSIQEKKIRVTFLPADGTAAATNGVSHEEQPPAYNSPIAVASGLTPARKSVGPDDSLIGDRSFGDTTETSHSPAPAQQQSSIGAAAAAIGLPTSQDELKRQLDAANAKIQQLQQQATEGLRQRKPATGDEKSVTASGGSLQTAPAPGGVSVQIVALLCLLSFLIAYMFF
ncbi:VAMP-associated protein [Acrodontium crateriforme]|uniref:VAMP-associated protein n=1 Tax=Acrodontium crateriforme TaxID=150365 RepID=A0AAQ3MA31_9PEZI|nr:VAMP-associated protein [Acrodontium crateriforme]